jgi:hypothetical protein
LLDDGRAVANASATDDVADPDLHEVAAAQLAVDSQVEQRPVAQSLVLVEVEPDAQISRGFSGRLGPTF